MMDVILTALFLVAVDGYLTGAAGRRRGWLQLGLATGLGVLMKSVLGLFPLAVAVAHRLTVRGFRTVIEPGVWFATLAAVVVGAPWCIYQLSVHGEQLLGEHVRWLIWNRGFVAPGVTGAGNEPFG